MHNRSIFIKRLALYVRSGIPLLAALDLIQELNESRRQSKIVETIAEEVRRGIPLSHALSLFPRQYKPVHIQLIVIGEESGTLPNSLVNLAQMFDRRARLTRTIINTLTYPFIILISTLGISTFLVFFVFPKIVPLFRGMHTSLPFTTRVLMWMSVVFRLHGILIAVVSITIVIICVFLLRIQYVRARSYRTILRTPFIGGLVSKYFLVLSFRALSTLLSSGVRINVALARTAESLSNTTYRKAFEDMELTVLAGGKISACMKSYTFLFPALSYQLVSVGESTGTLSKTTATIADIYEELLEEELRMFTNLLEPLLMVVMGFVVGFVALAIITPMYGLTQSFSAQ